MKIKTKVILSKDFCSMDAIRYVANRYGTTAEQVLNHYLVQTGIVKPDVVDAEDDYMLTPNEIALFRDLGVQPSVVEIC